MLTNGEALIMLVTAALSGYVLYKAVYWLNLQDWLGNRVSYCPPHQWDAQYRDPTEEEKADNPALTHVYCGLRCGKCKRTPGSLHNINDSLGKSGPWQIG